MTLEGGGKFEITQAKYRLSEEQKQEDGQKLFDFCAQCLKAFVETHKAEGHIGQDQVLPLGFTVSSPWSVCYPRTEVSYSSRTPARKWLSR